MTQKKAQAESSKRWGKGAFAIVFENEYQVGYEMFMDDVNWMHIMGWGSSWEAAFALADSSAGKSNGRTK